MPPPWWSIERVPFLPSAPSHRPASSHHPLIESLLGAGGWERSLDQANGKAIMQAGPAVVGTWMVKAGLQPLWLSQEWHINIELVPITGQGSGWLRDRANKRAQAVCEYMRASPGQIMICSERIRILIWCRVGSSWGLMRPPLAGVKSW